LAGHFLQTGEIRPAFQPFCGLIAQKSGKFLVFFAMAKNGAIIEP
jgi:hypothetical protein